MNRQNPYFEKNLFEVVGPWGKYIPRTEFEFKDPQTGELYFRAIQGRLDPLEEAIRWTINKDRPHYLKFQDLEGHTLFELKWAAHMKGGMTLRVIDHRGEDYAQIILSVAFGVWKIKVANMQKETLFTAQREGFDRSFRFFYNRKMFATARKEYPESLMAYFQGDARYRLRILEEVPKDWRYRPLLLATVLGIEMLVR